MGLAECWERKRSRPAPCFDMLLTKSALIQKHLRSMHAVKKPVVITRRASWRIWIREARRHKIVEPRYWLQFRRRQCPTTVLRYGNALNVIHAIREYEKAGTAAVVIEDKTFPKVTGLAAGGRQELLRFEEFHGKIEAALPLGRIPTSSSSRAPRR